MLQTQYYGIQVSSLRKTDKPTDYYNLWLPTRIGLINYAPYPIWQVQ